MELLYSWQVLQLEPKTTGTNMTKLTEKEIDYKLMRAVQNGDMVAFSDMVDRYKNRLMNVIGRMLSSTEEAEDIVQESYLRSQRGSVEPINNPKYYLTTQRSLKFYR